MQTIIPHLALSDAPAAIEFYKKAFGAIVELHMPAPDGTRVLHARLKIGESVFMLASEFPEYGGNCKSPKTVGGTTVTIHIVSPKVDKTIADAVAAGATLTMPPADMFWGDRYGQIRDPFGHMWSVATPISNLNPEEMKAAAAEAFQKHPNCSDSRQQQHQQQ